MIQPVPIHVLTEEGQISEDYPSHYMYNRFVRKGDEVLRLTGKMGVNKSDPFLFYRVKCEPERSNILSDDGLTIMYSKFPKYERKPTAEDIAQKTTATETANESSPKAEQPKKRGSFWFAQFHVVGFPEGNVAVFRNKEFMHQENEKREIVIDTIEDKQEYIAKLFQCYPQYGRENIQKVIDSIWNTIINPDPSHL